MENVYELTVERNGKVVPGRVLAVGRMDAVDKRECILARFPDAVVIEYNTRTEREERWSA